MAHDHDTHDHSTLEIAEPHVPCWAKIVAPLVALAILYYLCCSFCNLTTGIL